MNKIKTNLPAQIQIRVNV